MHDFGPSLYLTIGLAPTSDLSAARLVYDLKPSDHVTTVLKDLHWFPIKQRVEYKLCMLVQKVSAGSAPLYLSDMLTACADVPSLARLRASSSGDYVVPRDEAKVRKSFRRRRSPDLEQIALRTQSH